MNRTLVGLCAWWAAAVHAAAPTTPHYTRPADPGTDMKTLELQRRQGVADQAWWLERVALYTSMGELDSIAPLVEQLVLAWPAQPVFREARMILASGQGRHDDAVALGESVLAEFPGYPSIRANLARVQHAKGDSAAALNLMLAAIELGPVRVQDWDFLLRTLARTDGDVAGIISRLEQKVAANPNLKGLRYLQVILYVRLGRHSEARAILGVHPEIAVHPELQRYIADLHAGSPEAGGVAAP